MLLRSLYLILITLAVTASNCFGSDRVVIADQDESAPLVGNTLPALVLAAATGADFLAQQLVMTKDDHLVALDDVQLGNMTNVASIFPERKREDGNFYAIDFNLAEIQQLSRTRVDFEAAMDLRIPSFEDIILLTQKLEKEFDRTIGIYPEIKKPWFHAKEGKDISSSTLKMLKRYGYKGKDNAVYLACFDADELQRIQKKLMPAMGLQLKLVQFIDVNDGEETKRQENKRWMSYNYDWMFTQFGLKLLSSYADAIGLRQSMLFDDLNTLVLSDYTTAAQGLGLQLHAIMASTTTDEPFHQLFETSHAEALITGDWSGAVMYLKQYRNDVAQATDKVKTETEGSIPLN